MIMLHWVSIYALLHASLFGLVSMRQKYGLSVTMPLPYIPAWPGSVWIVPLDGLLHCMLLIWDLC